MRIAILGGTGKEGKGLAHRWAKAGHEILIGSRLLEKAQTAAADINAAAGRQAATGLENPQAAVEAELVVLTVPYAAQHGTLEGVRAGLAGKILVVTTVPLDPANVRRVSLPPGGSAAAEAQAQLGSDVRVVAAFENVAYERLLRDEPADCDVLVCGNDREAKARVIALANEAGLDAFDAGPIDNAVVPESLTAALININIRFKVKSSGIRITGITRR